MSFVGVARCKTHSVRSKTSAVLAVSSVALGLRVELRLLRSLNKCKIEAPKDFKAGLTSSIPTDPCRV